jgi:glycosyltransferase involved in cell wall biosynthesis
MKLAFVPPRFGPGVLGGSEALVREAAYGFAARGHDVEVVTTCALDHYSWANELPAGPSEENGLLVRRFPVVRHPSRAALSAQLSIHAGRVPDLDHQVSWLGFQFGAPGVFEHILRFGEKYDAIIFSPYMFWTTSVCVPFVAERAVVVPCLHDEVYARLDILRPVLSDPALAWFLSGPEHLLAHRLGPVTRRHSVTGGGVPVPSAYDPQGFMERHRLERPFVLYAGRREEGKNTDWMLESFAAAGRDGGLDLDLVLLGKGQAPGRAEGRGSGRAEGRAGGLRGGLAGTGGPSGEATTGPGRVIDLGFVSDHERDSAFAAATAYIQPSRMESFSRTVMEAWLAGTPVIAFDQSEVVAWHCRRSGGGVTFSDRAGLAECLRLIASRPELGSEMAAAGRRYVIENYTWPTVLDRMEASLRAAL